VTSLNYAGRLKRLQDLAADKGVDVVVIEDPSSVFYFTGYRGSGYVAASTNTVVLAVPVLEYRRAMDYLRESGLEESVELVVFRPYGLPGRLVVEEEGVRLTGDGVKGLLSLLVDSEARRCGVATVSHRFFEQLHKHCEDIADVTDDIMNMRLIKEPWEVERIKIAAEIAEAALQAALEELDYGVSEAEIAGVIEMSIREAGGEGPSFPPIVAFGDNTVYPHSLPSRSRVLLKPLPVLIDLGAIYEGYRSDMTRTLFFDGSPAEFRHVAEAVHEALTAVLDKAGPGVTTGELDAAARSILDKYGLAKYFIHSLGHGVGIDIHERPRVTYSDKTVLEPGMVITIEPGVYIPGKLGVRIEDLIVVTHRRAAKLTRFETWLWR